MDVSPNDSGAVEVDETVQSSLPVTIRFDNGAAVRLKAIPAPGYHFDSWSGDLTGTGNPSTVIMSCNKRVTANFSQVMHTLTMRVDGNGSINPAVGNHSYAEGVLLKITAVPESGWQFDSWTGEVTTPDSPTTTVIVDSEKTIAARFSRILHTLAIQVDGNGSSTPAVGNHSYAEGTVVQVTAIPDSGWQFDGWMGVVVDPDSPTTTVIMDSEKRLTASFSRILHTLTMQVDGNGSTTPAVGNHSYAEGALLEITAVPESGWKFDGWVGEVTEPDMATTIVAVNSDKTLTASFSPVSPVWPLIVGVLAGVIVIGGVLWLVIKRRTA